MRPDSMLLQNDKPGSSPRHARRRRLAFGIAARVLAACATVAIAEAPATTILAQPAAQSQNVKLATSAFMDGKKLFESKKFPQALEKFKQSYDLVPSPNSHIYIARCQSEMGQLKDAYKTFEDVITEADIRAKTEPKYAPTRDSAKQELGELSKKIGVVAIMVHTDNAAATVKMNGGVVARPDWGKDLPVDPGAITVTLEQPGSDTATQTVNVQKGQKQTVDIAPPTPQVVAPPPPIATPKKKKPPFLPVGIALAGVGVVGFGMFAVGGALSTSTYGELKDKCGENGPCPDATNNDLVDKGKTQQLVANIGLGIGCVGVAASVPFFILAATSKGKSDEHAKGAPEPEIGVDISPSYAGLHGTF